MMSQKNASMYTHDRTGLLRGRQDTPAWTLGNDTKLYLNQTRSSSSDDSTQDSDQSSDEEQYASSQSSCSTVEEIRTSKETFQLEGLFKIPEKHLLPGMARSSSPSKSEAMRLGGAATGTSLDDDEHLCAELSFDMPCKSLAGLPTMSCHRPRHSRYLFSSSGSPNRLIEKPNFSTQTQALISKDAQIPDIPRFPNGQQLTSSVLAIRELWASLEASRGPEKRQTNLQLITDLSRRISVDGCTLFEYHISHLLEGDNHVLKMTKLWLSLSAGQRTYWRKHSSKFQLPLAFEYWQLALRNLETEDHEERYSSLVRKAKRILGDASVDPEGHLIASPNWRHPVPERELQLQRLGIFAATRKIQRRLHAIKTSFGERNKILCRSLAAFIGSSGWTIFAYHGIPRVEEDDEMEMMAKLRAIWSGMTADDRLYWMEVSGRLLEGLKGGSVEALVYFSFDAWAVREARMSAEAWGRLIV